MAATPALERLDPLVGDWSVEATVAGNPVARARMRVHWIEDGCYLAVYSEAVETEFEVPREWSENNPFPTKLIIGLDDTADRFAALYADARGVTRIYHMAFDGRTWSMWRDAPGFDQRFAAMLDAEGVWRGAWETSTDGTTWTRDFDVAYVRQAR